MKKRIQILGTKKENTKIFKAKNIHSYVFHVSYKLDMKFIYRILKIHVDPLLWLILSMDKKWFTYSMHIKIF